MEFDLIFWLAIVAIYIFQAIAGRKKKPQPQDQIPPADGVPDQHWEQTASEPPADIEEALSEIGRLLRGEEPKARPRPEPVAVEPEPAPLPTLAPAPARPAPTRQREFRNSESSRTYDDPFERKSKTFKAPVITHDHEFSFSDPAEIDRSRKSSPTPAPDLTTAARSREALIAAEILAPPVSKRPGRR